MKLRQKSYLFTVLLIALVLYASTLVLLLPNILSTVDSIRSRALSEEKALALAVDGLFDSIPNGLRAKYVRGFAMFDSDDSAFAVGEGTELWIATDPVPITEPGTMRWVNANGRTVLAVSDTLSDGVWLRYGLDATETLKRTERQAIGSVLICTCVTAGIAVILYVMLERINRPIERLAHELRTPLTVIHGYGELLERAKLTPEQQHNAASYIVSESKRLGEISEKLLTMSDARGRAYRPERLDLSALAEHLRRTYPTLETDISWDTVTGDRALMLSLLGNLIGNAVKASPKDAPVLMKARPGEIMITDHGRGMNAELLAYVNDPVRKNNPSIRSGLGVPLCHEIAALHGATLSFISEEGKGTTAAVQFER